MYNVKCTIYIAWRLNSIKKVGTVTYQIVSPEGTSLYQQMRQSCSSECSSCGGWQHTASTPPQRSSLQAGETAETAILTESEYFISSTNYEDGGGLCVWVCVCICMCVCVSI